MPFSDFTNPFQNPADVPEAYRRHPRLHKLFQPDGSYTRPLEDPVTLWAIDVLYREYNVPLEAMELEVGVDFSEAAHQSGSGRRYMGFVDLVIYDDRYKDARGNLDVAFIALEAMEPGIALDSEGDDQTGVGHFKRLNAYVSASASARYAILTNGSQTRIYRRDFEYPRALQPIGDLPKYESAAEAARHSPYTVVLNPDKPDGIDTGLVPLTRDKFREVLGDTRSGCHSILRDNEGLQPQEAIDAMVKFLFAKWYDEQATIDLAKQTGEKRAYMFVDIVFLHALLMSRITLNQVVPLQSGTSLPRVSASHVLDVRERLKSTFRCHSEARSAEESPCLRRKRDSSLAALAQNDITREF